MRRLIIALLLLAAPAAAQEHPKFFITAERTAIWAQMKTDYEANTAAPATLGGRMYKYIKGYADSGTMDGDVGQFDTWMYHVSGDASYASQAVTEWTWFLSRDTACVNTGLGGDFSRFFFIQFVWQYDWLYPAMTTQQRTDFRDKLNLMAECNGVGHAPYGLEDSDQVMGDYFGMAMWYVSTGSYNTTAATVWNDATRKWGGLVATGANRSTYRNAVYQYMTQFAAGGEFVESYVYNNGGTVKLFMAGADAINTWQGTESFAEITAWVQDGALQYIHDLTPNSATAAISPTGDGAMQPFIWGDTDNNPPRAYRAFRYYETALMYAGLTKGTASGPIIQDWVMDREGATPLDTLRPDNVLGFILFDPAATRGDWTTTDPTKYASGMRLFNSKTGWGASDSWFMAHYPPGAYIDHQPIYFGAFRLWKNGAWAINFPDGYDSPTKDSRGTNGISFSGVPVHFLVGPKEFRGAMATKTAITPVNYSYIAGTQGGDMWGNHAQGGSVSYIMEHTRSLVWLRDWDVIVAFDRANSKPPTIRAWSPPAGLWTWMTSRPRKELYVHTAVSPTQVSNYSDWIYDGASAHTRVTHLLPASSTKTIENESTLWTGSYFQVGTWTGEAASERKYHVKIVPTATNQWEPFLNIWDAYATGTPATVALVQDTTAKADGALITKGTTNVLALFNSLQGADLQGPVEVTGYYFDWVPANQTILGEVRLRSAGYEVVFAAAGGSSTKALLFDLDPSGDWTYQINGGTVTPMAVTAEGIGTFETSTTGTVTLAVDVTGIDEPVEVVTGSLPDGRLNVAYTDGAITAQFGDGGPYTCSKTAGTLPTGMVLADDTACATGITGTPSALSLGSSISKTAADGWGTAGASSIETIASGDGYVTSTAGGATNRGMFGLSVGSANDNYTEIDYAIHQANGLLYIFENGTQKGTNVGAYAKGDVLKVGIESGVVKYRKNGTLLYTSLVSPSYPLLVDTAIYVLGGTLNNIIIAPAGVEATPTWATTTNVNVFGSTYSFTVEACDSLASCGTRDLTMAVTNPLIISATDLPAGTVGEAYTGSCTAVGGTEPYTFSLADSTTLPPGLSLNASTCAITATAATALGTYAFTLRVTDDVGAFWDQAAQITIAQQANLVGMSVRAVASAAAAIINFSVSGLPTNDACTVYLKDGETTLDTAESAAGTVRRRVYFTGLEAGKTFGVDVICGLAQSERIYFQTSQTLVGGTIAWKYVMVPNGFMQDLSATKLTVEYNLPGEAAASATNASCSSGCTVTLTLTSGAIYEIRHIWKTAADVVLAISLAAPVVVP